MNLKAFFLIGFLLVALVLGYLNLSKQKELSKNLSNQLHSGGGEINNVQEAPAAVKNQIEENLNQSQAEKDKNISND